MILGTDNSAQYHEILLDDLPVVDTFLGVIDLKTGALIIAAICVLHPLVYGCTLFIPMSYVLYTIWLLLALFFFFSILLFWGLIENDTSLIHFWIWYSVLFVLSMVLLLLLLATLYASKKQWVRVAIVLLGVLWYILIAYFVIVVNSHRRAIMETSRKNTLQLPMESPNITDSSKSENTDPPAPINQKSESETESSEQPTTTITPETNTDPFKLLRKAFFVKTPTRLFHQDFLPLAPVSQNIRSQGLSPEVHFSQEDTTTT